MGTGAQARRVFGIFLAAVLAASLLLESPAPAQTDPGIITTQTADREPATVGQPHAFDVTVTNNSVPQHVGFKDFLPEGMELVSAKPSQGTCGPSHHGTNGVECGFGELPSGGSATVEIVATPTIPGTMTNTVIGGGELSPQTPERASITVNPAVE